MSSGVILLQRPYISFSSPLLLILRREITAAAVALFDPGTSTSGLSSGVTVGGAGSSLVQTTSDPAVLSATQPVQAPSTRGPVSACKSATSPVESPGTSVAKQNATQPVEVPGAGMATQPVEAPGAGPEVLLTGTSSAALHAEMTGSDSEEEL